MSGWITFKGCVAASAYVYLTFPVILSCGVHHVPEKCFSSFELKTEGYIQSRVKSLSSLSRLWQEHDDFFSPWDQSLSLLTWSTLFFAFEHVLQQPMQSNDSGIRAWSQIESLVMPVVWLPLCLRLNYILFKYICFMECCKVSVNTCMGLGC